MIRVHHLFALACALAVGATTAAMASGATESPRPFERIGHVPGPLTHSARPSAPAHVSGITTVVVDDSWSALSNGTVVTVGSSFTIGTDAFATIQAGIDAVDAGGTVKVLPGTYLEIAAGRYLYDSSGPYQFGVFVGAAKSGLTIQGVDAAGNPINTSAGVLTTVNYDATNSFGTSGFFIEGDHVTIRGLGIGSQKDPDTADFGTNKTIEVIGDDFKYQACTMNDNGFGDIYIDDWRATPTTSYVQSYQVTGSVFADGNTVDIASGPGIQGPVSGRQVTNNTFTMSDNYNSISFTGTTPAVGWLLYPVGGAVVTGNSFTNTNPAGTIIKARGVYDNSQFDWATYWTGNTFNHATCEGIAPPANLRAYAYSVYTNTRRIEATIQGEVDNAVSGDQVLVRGGTYAEQVVVNGKNVVIQGAGRAATTIQSPATLVATFTTSGPNMPIVTASNASDVELRDVTVDGMGLGSGSNYRFHGVDFWNAGGKVMNCDITRIRETPFNGDQHGVGIYTFNNTGGPYSLEVGACNVTDFQKNAMALSGAGLVANVHDCTVTGQGPTSLNAQNGIQFDGATCAITNCTVSGIHYTGPGVVAVGLLLYGPSSVTVTGCHLSGNQYSVYSQDASGTLNGTSITNTVVPGGYAPLAVEIYNSAASTMATAARLAGSVTTHVPPPPQPVLDASPASRANKPNSALSNLMTFNIAGGCFTGPGDSGTQGIDAYSEGADLQVGITGAEISGWEWGIGTGGPGGVSMNANHNSITGNSTAGYYFYGPAATSNLATLNWWGNAGGPGAGGANPVLGAGVISSPYLVTGADSNPGCGFTAGADNIVAAGPAPSCLSQANTCITIPVTIARTTSDNVRGYSVTLQLSSNLDLCSGTSSIVQGTYLNSIAGTNFEVVANGLGSYTVDCAILGSTCGATAPAGTLFTLAVKKNGLDGPATVSLTSVVARDCDNGPVAVTAGAPLGITIDTVSPVAPGALAASQLKTGNDADGTTKVKLTFTPPPSATVEVYRAGFGHYPLYDDAGGAVPALPVAYPPAAPWALTGVTASGQYDETTTRDFWYYVAYAKDACGNVSSVSTRTGGTLNYHLGDVVDLASTFVGDNTVYSADISRLGAHYGLSSGNPGYLDYLDVGPTTDFSVNARPTTDDKVGFEDLMMFAINFNVVSAPQVAAQPAAADQDAIALVVPELPGVGETFAVSVRMKAAGDVQGASVRVAYDAAVVEPVGVEAGSLLQSQGRGSVALSPEPGTVDFALLGTGGGLAGDGEAAQVLFRVRSAGKPGIALGSVIARDEQNQVVALGRLGADVGDMVPARTELGPVFPNPAVHTASLQLSLARESSVRVALYDLAGRRVRTLVNGVQPAGVRILTWDGRSDAGVRMAPGVYIMRLEAGGVNQSRRLQFLP